MPEPSRAPVRTWIVVCLLGFAVFGGIALGVHLDTPLTAVDRDLADTLHASQKASPDGTKFFREVSDLAGIPLLNWTVLIVAAILLYLGRYWLAAAWAMAVEIASFGTDHALKYLLQRERPFHSMKHATDWSFPSGHSLRGFVMYGLLAYLLVLVLPRRGARLTAVAAAVLVVGLIGFSRIYLGKHYLSDVLAGFAFGAGWMALWIALIEGMGWCKQQRAVWHQRALAALHMGGTSTPPPTPESPLPGVSPSGNAPGV
jgi:undecaprenyl-diphosphatase